MELIELDGRLLQPQGAVATFLPSMQPVDWLFTAEGEVLGFNKGEVSLTGGGHPCPRQFVRSIKAARTKRAPKAALANCGGRPAVFLVTPDGVERISPFDQWSQLPSAGFRLELATTRDRVTLTVLDAWQEIVLDDRRYTLGSVFLFCEYTDGGEPVPDTPVEAPVAPTNSTPEDPDTAPAAPSTVEDLLELKRDNLIARAREVGVSGDVTKMNKRELAEEILGLSPEA